MSHTPGPWSLEKQEHQNFTAIGEPIAVVGGEATGENVEFVIGRACDWGPHGDEQTTANARLIAAAPELLAACIRTKEILDAWGPERRGDSLERLHERVDAAIARAEGTK